MAQQSVDYEYLKSAYLDHNSLFYKKLQIVNSYIGKGHTFLDIGIGTGELIELVKDRFDVIYGIDNDIDAFNICRRRFQNNNNIYVLKNDVGNIEQSLNNKRFDYITCLDVLEHIDLNNCKNVLRTVCKMLKNDGVFIFSGPGIFEKMRIALGLSPTHIHSHSSYGWRKMIENAGFRVSNIETVEFPVIHSNILRKRLHIFGKCCMIITKKLE